jgi:hypothetical protein
MNIRRRPERGSVWRIAPPLTVKREDIDLAMTIFDQALTEMKGGGGGTAIGHNARRPLRGEGSADGAEVAPVCGT